MRKSAENSTYAVSLYFDDETSAKILKYVERVANAAGNSFMTDNSVPPHVTLGMFHACDGAVQEMKDLFRNFCEKAGKIFPLKISGAGTFLNKVIFFRFEENERLHELNAMLHESFLSFFEPGGNRNYLPENWFPHVSLAMKLRPDEFEKGIREAESFFKENDFLRGAKIVSAGLAHCNPYSEISFFSLSNGDNLSVSQRHNNMAAIRSTGNSLETQLRSRLFKFGFRFRKNDKRLLGSPDIVFPRYHAVIFVNGCFWHAHGWKADDSSFGKTDFEKYLYNKKRCEKFHFPHTNVDFWYKKFKRNQERDIRDIQELLEQGWRVGVVWECSLTGKKRREKINDAAASISFWLEEEIEERFREF